MADPALVSIVGNGDGSIAIWTWTLTTADPTGTAVEIPEYADKTWSFSGTLGAAVGAIQGANVNTDAVFAAQSNAAGGTALTVNALPACIAMIENPRFVRPKLTTVGSGATWTVTLCARRANPMRT